jgi:hypothetical protein
MPPDNSVITNIIGMGWYKMAYIFDLFVNAMNAAPRVVLVLYTATAGIDFTITIASALFRPTKSSSAS